MAMVFGRTEHDTVSNPKKKNTLTRAFNTLCLIFMYVLFIYYPYHRIYWDGMKPHLSGRDGAASTQIVCKAAFFGECAAGCEKSGLFGLDCKATK